MGLSTAKRDSKAAIAESAGEPPAWGSIGLDQAETAYRDLMAGYGAVLGKASRLRRRGGEDVAEKLNATQISGGLVRLMLQAHVRSRLEELSSAYAQLAPAMRSAEDEGKHWLDVAQADASRIAGTLHRVRLRPLALLPIVVPIGALLSNIPGWVGYLFLALSGAIVTFAWLGYTTLRESYRYKRKIMLPNASEIDKRAEAEQWKVRAGNVYNLEDRAFAAIGRGKKPEAQIDRLIRMVVLILLFEALWIVPIVIWDGRYILPTVAVVGPAFVGLLLWLRREQERVWL